MFWPVLAVAPPRFLAATDDCMLKHTEFLKHGHRQAGCCRDVPIQLEAPAGGLVLSGPRILCHRHLDLQWLALPSPLCWDWVLVAMIACLYLAWCTLQVLEQLLVKILGQMPLLLRMLDNIALLDMLLAFFQAVTGTSAAHT